MNQEKGVEITTDYKADKLWDDCCRPTATTNVKESIIMNCGSTEDGKSLILEEKPFLLMKNSLNLIK
ncbi:hypothetical protein LOAG_14843 [Loa loa]|uniref:Uncharacterized protein n=1 Tax=Loa loa TaxID=7209 RepID=A0A1S0THH6_LOALO|nr:hypothetical protein LOAG_14843 [Loa loa]EFO13685.2 hypothetical protein LOAG_14843 [Loa loa]